jgi:hypothetical protein
VVKESDFEKSVDAFEVSVLFSALSVVEAVDDEYSLFSASNVNSSVFSYSKWRGLFGSMILEKPSPEQ